MSAQVLGGELHAQLVGAGREHPAGGHHLHDVDAPLDVLGHRRPDGIGPFRHPAEVVAVAALGRQGRPRRDDPRQPGAAASRKPSVR